MSDRGIKIVIILGIIIWILGFSLMIYSSYWGSIIGPIGVLITIISVIYNKFRFKDDEDRTDKTSHYKNQAMDSLKGIVTAIIILIVLGILALAALNR